MHWTDMAHHVARKRHLCDLCSRWIEPGETYGRQRGYDAGDAWTFRECAHCEAVWVIYAIEPFNTGMTYDDMDAWATGRYWSDLTEVRHAAGWRMRWRTRTGTLLPIPSREDRAA